MVGIVLVSHSEALARGVADLINEIGLTAARAVPAGGTDDGRLGTSPEKVATALVAADTGDGVVILADLGSAVLTSRLALEDSDARAQIADAPFVEGAVAAAGAAVTGADLPATVAAAEQARHIRKT